MSSSSPHPAPFLLTPLDNSTITGAHYAHLALFFPNSSSDDSQLVQKLTSALAQTFNAIPVLAGTVTYYTDAPEKGRLAVTGPWRTAKDAIMVKDLKKTDYPSYETLRSKHFPTVDLKYHTLMPTRRSMHISRVQTPVVEETPVLLAQINFIKGGMILGFIFDHAFTDGAGTVTVAKVWAAYCRGEDGSRLLSPDCLDRTPLMESDESGRIEDFKMYKYRPEPTISAPAQGFLSRTFNNVCLWFVHQSHSVFDSRINATYKTRAALRIEPADETAEPEPDPLAGEIFFFSHAKLRELKAMASKLEGDATSWISTNDALASLLWCCVAVAHRSDTQNQFDATKEVTQLGFVINARRLARPPLPPHFIGNVLIWGHIVKPYITVVPTAKGVTDCAHILRHKIRQYNNTYLPRLVQGLNSLPDLSRVQLDYMGLEQRTVVVNSWAAHEWYDLDWGKVVGGRCERIRTHMSKVANFCLVLPELKGGEGNEEVAGLEVMITIKHHHMTILRESELFNRFAEWRCS